MFTVTSTIAAAANGVTVPITGLTWLPSGPAASTVNLTAGEWVMLVWATPSATYPYYRRFGVNIGGTETWGPEGNSVAGGDFYSSLRFSLAADTAVQPIGKRVTNTAIPHLFKPGDVIGFAPVVAS